VKELRVDEVRNLVVDGRADEDDAFVEQPRVDVEGALAAARLLDHGWNHRRHAGTTSR